MKISKSVLCLVMLGMLGLVGCQDEKTPVAKASSPSDIGMHASSQPANTSASEKLHSQPHNLPVKSAVAVTKPDTAVAENHVQAAMHALKAEVNGEQGAAKRAMMNQLAAVKASKKVAVPAPATENLAAVSPAKHVAVAKKIAPISTQDAVVKPASKVAKAVVVATKPKSVAIVGDAAKGKVIARKCQGCHNFTAKKKVGPGLKGIVGRQAGMMPGMRYSKALKAGGWVWDEQHLHAWDCDSRKAIKLFTGNPSAKTKMPPQHICDETKLANLIAFLKTL